MTEPFLRPPVLHPVSPFSQAPSPMSLVIRVSSNILSGGSFQGFF